MLIFFDTEFTELGANSRLISIGFVSEDGQREFYAELSNTYQIADCSDFVRESVLPQLQGGSSLMSVRELAVKLIPWLKGFKEPVQLATDSLAWDWSWMQVIYAEFGGYLLENTQVWDDMRNTPSRLESVARPSNVDAKPVLLHEVSLLPAFDRAMGQAFESGLRRHHALDDAKANRLGWLAVNGF